MLGWVPLQSKRLVCGESRDDNKQRGLCVLEPTLKTGRSAGSAIDAVRIELSQDATLSWRM